MKPATQESFLAAKNCILAPSGRTDNSCTGIGTLSEKTTHAVLKHMYAPDPAFREIPVEGSIADICTGDEIIEIQSANFHTLRKKLDKFLPLMPVTIVYPVARFKWLHWLDPLTGEIISSRKSPKAGDAYEIFRQLVYIMPYLTNENLHLCVTLLDMDEYRLLDGKRSRDKKRGSHRCDRIPRDFAGEVRLDCPQDYMQFVPYPLDEPFTAKEFEKAARTKGRVSQNAVTVLQKLGILTRVGKRGNAYLYTVHEI